MYNILCFCLTHWSTSVTAGNPKFYRYGLPHPTTSCWEMACFTFAPNILVNCHPMDRDNSVRKPLNTESNYNSNFFRFLFNATFPFGKRRYITNYIIAFYNARITPAGMETLQQYWIDLVTKH